MQLQATVSQTQKSQLTVA